jgi:hypothetical protein
MLRNLAFIAAVTVALASCGGDDPPDIAQCNGTPRAAVVYVGNASFPELAGIPNACVYSTRTSKLAELDPLVDRALKEADRPRVYFIGAYTDLPLRFRAHRPGISESTSLWFAPDNAKADGIENNITGITVNDTTDGAAACNGLVAQLKAHHTTAQCILWDVGGFVPAQRAEAILQLHLELAQ